MSSETVTRNDLTAILNEVLPNPADMTPQEVEDFVDGLNVTGINAVDYVVEQGTSGIWTYRKWASGIAECWGIHTHSVTSWHAWGSLYESIPATYATYPTDLFTSTPLVMIVNATTANGICGIELYQGSPSKDQTPNFHFLRPSTGSAFTANANIYAKGRWK